MKADILNYLDNVSRTISNEADRELNPSKILQLRAKVEIVGQIAAEIKRALPDEMKPEVEAPVPVQAELVE